jgi:hypothetical protein
MGHMDEGTSQSSESSRNNYFSVRNIIIYLLLAALLYGAVYFLFLNKSTSPAATLTPAATTPTAAAAPTTAAMEPMSVTLNAQNTSGESGTAILTEENEKTRVVLSMSGAPKGTPQPAHIHSGACPKPGDVVYPLTNVVNGASETVLDVDMEALMQQMPLAVNVHKSASQAAVYVACGDLK